MESLPSWNNFTHRATVRYGKPASHASRSPWKQVCALRPRATSIFIQECWSCFINMLLGRLNWASTLQDNAQCNSIKHNHNHSLYYFNWTSAIRYRRQWCHPTHILQVTTVLPLLCIQPLYNTEKEIFCSRYTHVCAVNAVASHR